jgi:superfamily II DNA or RNA helicase
MQYSLIPEANGNLRPHQIDAKRRIFESWDNYDSVMLQMPTGTGKTYLFTSLINDLLAYYKQQHIELHILVVAHRTELIDQISESLSRYGIPHGIVQGNREQQLWQRVQVASIQSILSAKNSLNTIRQKFDYIIVDEAHHSLAESYRRLFETFPKAKKLGVTATPCRLNHESFLSLYQILLTTPQVSWFIDHHLLSDFDYVSIKPDSEMQRIINNTEVSQTGDFVNIELDHAFNNQRIRAKLFDSYKQYAWGRKGIIYAINKQHAYNIASLYSSEGVNAVAIDCDTPKEERQYLVDEFKKGDIQVLVNVQIFTEGFDCPDVSFIQLARPTRSLALYLQQVGRGLRIKKGKEKTIILDNVGLYNYFGLPDANRMWQYHFKGHDVPDGGYTSCMGENGFGLRDYTGPSLDEDNEEMTIVRGERTHKKAIFKALENKVQVNPIEEFSLCDYYLIHGNSNKFRVYPFIKKRGKITGGVANCVLDYDSKKEHMTFGPNALDNVNMVARNSKVQNIVYFAATFCQLSVKRLLSLPTSKEISLFELLKHISDVYNGNVKGE